MSVEREGGGKGNGLRGLMDLRYGGASKCLSSIHVSSRNEVNWGGVGGGAPDGGMLQTQEDPVWTDSGSGNHFPVSIQVPHIEGWLIEVERIVTIDVGGAIRAEMSCLVSPGAE